MKGRLIGEAEGERRLGEARVRTGEALERDGAPNLIEHVRELETVLSQPPLERALSEPHSRGNPVQADLARREFSSDGPMNLRDERSAGRKASKL